MIGPALPPNQRRGTSENGSPKTIETGPALEKEKRVIGPALPPSLQGKSGEPAKTAGEKRSWAQIREMETKEKVAEHFADSTQDREEWMTVPPSTDRHWPVLRQRAFSSGTKFPPDENGRSLWTSVPGKDDKSTSACAGSAAINYEGDGDDTDDQKTSSEECSEKNNTKRPRTAPDRDSSAPSLLDMHRREACKEKLCAASDTYSPWDREKDLVVNHKKRNVSHYNSRYGSLNTRYSSSSSKQSSSQ